MLNTYIKNQGITQTIVHDNNNRSHFNQMNWDADYDGNMANISVNSNTDGKRNKFSVSLNNNDLANLLNIRSVNVPIDKRLKMDFQPSYNLPNPPSPYKPDMYFIELPSPELKPKKSEIIDELIKKGVSSPLSNEELIIPLTIDKKTADNYTLTPKKKHRRFKTHITHKVYKKPKSLSMSKSKSKSKSKSRSNLLRKSFSEPIVKLMNSI